MRIIFTCHIWAAEAAAREWRAAWPDMEWIGWIHDGVGLIDVPAVFPEIGKVCRTKPLLFTRHIFPVEWELLPDEDPAVLLSEALAQMDAARSYSVQARSHDGSAPTRTLSDALRGAGMRLDVRAPEQVISVFRAKKALYVGVSEAEDNLSTWNGGMMHFRADDAVSRAEFKLLEALRTFSLDLSQVEAALDLGAAPGGWTRVLAGDYGIPTTAVDPAALDTQVLKLPNVHHERKTAQEYLRENPDVRFDLIVDDMKMDARLSLSVLEDMRPLLRKGGVFLATLKLPVNGMADAAAEAVRRIRKGNELLFARQLFHNRNEATVAFRPREEQANHKEDGVER